MAKDTLVELVSQLSVQSSHNEHANVEQTCLQLLRSGCDEPYAILQKCLVAMIKQDKYQKGLRLMNEFRDLVNKHSEDLCIELLYIYYKLNNVQLFDRLYKKSVGENSQTVLVDQDLGDERLRGILHVRAQFCFKNGLYEEAYEIYQALVKTNRQEFDNSIELACNERVPLTSSPSLKEYKPLLSESDQSSYDVLFNDSIIMAAEGRFEESAELLSKVLRMAEADGYENDLNSIRLQTAYTLQLQNKSKQATTLLKQLLAKLPRESVLYLVAKSNLLSVKDFSKYADNYSLVLRDLNYELANSFNLQKFTYEQWVKLQSNFSVLSAFNNSSINANGSEIAKALQKYKKEVGNIVLEPYKVQASKVYKLCSQMLGCTPCQNMSGFVILTLQLLIVAKQWQNAVRIGEKYLNKCWNPAENNTHHHSIDKSQVIVCCVLLQLYSLTHRNRSKYILLEKLNAIRKAYGQHAAREREFWVHIGFQYLVLGNNEQARDIFEQFGQSVDTNIDMVELTRLTSDIDVDELVRLGSTPMKSKLRLQESDTTVAKLQRQKVLILKQKRRALKKRKFLTGKDVVKKPDPERWLPQKDRSSYKPKKKQLNAKLTQGGAMSKRAEQSLDIQSKPTPTKTKSAAKSAAKKKKKGRK